MRLRFLFIKMGKKGTVIGASPKGQFSKIRYISKEVCRISRLCTQMQCLSGKEDGLWGRTKQRLPCVKGAVSEAD